MGLRYPLGDRVELARTRVQFEWLDALDDLWTDYLAEADQRDVEREREELLELASVLRDAISVAERGLDRLVGALQSISESHVDEALAAIGSRYPRVAEDFRLTLADVLEEYSVRGFIIDACLYLREQLPQEAEVVDAKRARIEGGEFQPGDLSPGVKCAINVALVGLGVVDIVTTGGTVSATVRAAAEQLGNLVLGWGDGCGTVAKRIWSRLRG